MVYESDPDAVCKHLIASEHVTDAGVLAYCLVRRLVMGDLQNFDSDPLFDARLVQSSHRVSPFNSALSNLFGTERRISIVDDCEYVLVERRKHSIELGWIAVDTELDNDCYVCPSTQSTNSERYRDERCRPQPLILLSQPSSLHSRRTLLNTPSGILEYESSFQDLLRELRVDRDTETLGRAELSGAVIEHATEAGHDIDSEVIADFRGDLKMPPDQGEQSSGERYGPSLTGGITR